MKLAKKIFNVVFGYISKVAVKVVPPFQQIFARSNRFVVFILIDYLFIHELITLVNTIFLAWSISTDFG